MMKPILSKKDLKKMVKPRAKAKSRGRYIGKPRKIVDEELLYKLAQTLLPLDTISDIVNCSKETLHRMYGHILQAGRANRKYSLVEACWHKALIEKDTKMLIWMSKQHLGYRDNSFDQINTQPFTVSVNPLPFENVTVEDIRAVREVPAEVIK